MSNEHKYFGLSNLEIVCMYNALILNKKRIDKIMKNKFSIVVQDKIDGDKLFESSKNLAFAMSVKPVILTDNDVDEIRDGEYYKTLISSIEKLKPVVEIIIDTDSEVKKNVKLFSIANE